MIRELREDMGLSQIELAEAIGVSERTMRRYEQEEDSIQIATLKKIFDVLGMSSDKSFFVQQMSSNPINDVQHSKNVTKSLLSPVTKSSDECYLVEKNENVHKSKSISLNDGVHKLSISPKPTAQINTDVVQIPIYDDVVASAGGGVINDEYPTQSVGIDKGFLRTHFGLSSFLGLSIITAKGDSMSPTIPENCQLLVQKSVPKEGQICVVRIDDELYVKRLQKLPKYRLISDNKSYENIELEGREYDIVGVVVGFFKRMI